VTFGAAPAWPWDVKISTDASVAALAIRINNACIAPPNFLCRSIAESSGWTPRVLRHRRSVLAVG
jgi:hypothetical protein